MSRSRHWLIAALLGIFVALLAMNWTIKKTPGFLMDRATDRLAGLGGWNAMAFQPLVDASSRTIVRPAPDLAYSSCAFDVSKGPVLVEVPVVPAPYWSLSVFDDQTNVAFVRNNLQAAGQPIRVAILQPGATAPAGYEPVPVEGTKGVALFRMLVAERTQFPALDQARRQASCRSVTAG